MVVFETIGDDRTIDIQSDSECFSQERGKKKKKGKKSLFITDPSVEREFQAKKP